MIKTLQSEKEWWEKNITSDELKKPYRSSWELYHWNTIFNKIIEIYNFNNKSVFDGGCGTGIFEEWLLLNHKPKTVVGMDLSTKMIQLAKKRKIRSQAIKFIEGNIEETKFKKNYFDICIIIDSLHHTPNLYKSLKEMKRIGKELIISEPNALNPIRRINEIEFRNQGVKEISFYSWELVNTLKQVGYKEIDITYQHFIPQSTPSNFIKFAQNIDPLISKIPIMRNFSGSILIQAK